MMIKAYKRYDGQLLGSNKAAEGSGENEGKIGDILKPPKTYHKNAYAPKPNPLRDRLNTTPTPLVFPPHTDDFQKPIKFKIDLGNDFIGKKGDKPSEELEARAQREPKTKAKTKTLPL
jgi:hypothetical protein